MRRFLLCLTVIALFAAFFVGSGTSYAAAPPSHAPIVKHSSMKPLLPCAPVHDGDRWNPCCAQSQIVEANPRFSVPGGSVVVWIYFSPDCNSVWSAVSNNTGHTLFNVNIFIERVPTGTVADAVYSSLTNPHTTSSTQVVKSVSGEYFAGVTSSSFSGEPNVGVFL